MEGVTTIRGEFNYKAIKVLKTYDDIFGKI